MAITNAQQYQQLVNKPANGKRPGYRGSSYGPPSRSSSQGPAGGASSGGNYGGNTNNSSSNNNSSTNQGPAGGASAGGNYGGNVNVKQEYGGKAYEDQSYATQESIDNAKKKEEVKKFQESLENDRKRRAKRKRRLEEAALNKKNLFNKLGYVQRTKDENLEDLGVIDSQGLTIGGYEVPSFISGIGSAFTIDPSTKYFDEDSIREIGSQTQYTKSVDPVTGKVTFGTTAKQADTLADLKEDIQMEDRVLDPNDTVTQSEFNDYMNRNKVELPDNDGGNQEMDPCKGPNPPAYCFVNNDPADPETPKRNLGGLAPRFAGSIFDFTGLADGGRAGKMDGGMMEDTPEGGIMDLESGRQMYFLGKLVKKATRAVKKVAKSPFGKAALGAALFKFGGGFGGGKGLAGLKSTLFGQAASQAAGPMKYLQGTPFTKGLFGKLGLTTGGGSMMPTLKGGLTLGFGLPFALDALGIGKDKDDDKIDLDEYYRKNSINIADIRNNPYNFLAPRFAADGGLMRMGYQEGGDAEPVAKKTMPLLDMDGMEKDYREEGGFVPIGRMERADDVPARLSKNEFVFTADAVRNAGEGDIDKGAEVMYNMMKNLESGGEVSEESQGLDGAREMFKTSQRLEEVL